MTSQINYTNIDELFPVAGQDNDSQGFRDNFDVIKTALTVTSSEITELQAKTVLTADLSNNTPVSNDLNGSTLANGKYENFNPTFQSPDISSATIDVSASSYPIKQILIVDDSVIRFTNWPSSELNVCGKIVLHIASSTNPYSVTFLQDAGTIVYSSDFPTPLTTDSSIANTFDVVEAWTYTGGSTVFVKHLGKFTTTPSNNRTISGNLSVTGSSTLGDTSGDIITINGIPKFPSLSTGQRDALTATTGMVIFNSTVVALQVCTVGGSGGTATWEDLN